MSKIISCVLVFALVLPGICQGDEDADIITITGRIERFTYDGGFYGIKGDDGTEYRPERLNDSYQREGLKVKVKARLVDKDKKLLTRGWGVLIDVISIEREESHGR